MPLRFGEGCAQRLASAVGGDLTEREAAFFCIRLDLGRFGEQPGARAENALVKMAYFEAAFDSAGLNDSSR